MRKSSYVILKNAVFIGLVWILYTACRKPETEVIDVPKGINVQANVPSLIYDNIKEVYLDAEKTTLLNKDRVLNFSWDCLDYPTASGKVDIKNSNEPRALIENPAIGRYKFQLTVKDNFGNTAKSDYLLDVLADTLAGITPVAKAGPDQQIYAPKNGIKLQGFETFSYNPPGRDLIFSWKVIQSPSGGTEAVIRNTSLYSAEVGNLIEGIYKIQLEVKNELGKSAYDTMEVQVLPDNLKGTTQIFENEYWELVYDDWGDYIAIVIGEPSLFENRNRSLEVNVWDAEKNDWSAPDKFTWNVNYGVLQIFYNWTDNSDMYFKMAGVKTRVKVKFN